MTTQCTKTACPYCGVGCGVEVNAKPLSASLNRGISITGDETHPANRGSLCVKGSALAESLSMPSRLLYPKKNGQEVSWDDATETIASKFHEAINKYGSDSVAMYVSGQLLTEDYYVANKLMKGYVGSANIDTNSRLCMSSAVSAHVRAFGEDVVPVNYDDLHLTDLLVIAGANTAWTHPVLFKRIQQAKLDNPNMKVIVIDPRTTVTAEQADLHLPIANDGDTLLFSGLAHYCMTHDHIDRTYVDSRTNGYQALKASLTGEQFDIDTVAETLGIPVTNLMTFYRWFAESPSAITLFCQGINQSESGVDKANTIINAHLLTGKIAKAGSGPFSITGQPNAMGGREVGGLANQLAVHRGFDEQSIAEVQAIWNAPNMATKPGLKAVELFEAVASGKIKALWIMATNPVVSMPDNLAVRAALECCDFVVVSDITGDADVAHYADILLPAAGWGEKQGMVTNSERVLSRQRQFTPPAGEAKPDWWAISQVGSRLCEKMAVTNGFAFQSEAEIFREYAKLTSINTGSPFLFDLSEFQEITDEEYQQWQPKAWPCKETNASRPIFSDGYSTPNGKANLVIARSSSLRVANQQNRSSSEEMTWWLNTGRQRDQWHTMTRTGHVERLTHNELEPTVYMNACSAEQIGVKSGEVVSVSAESEKMDQTLLAKVSIDKKLDDHQLFMSMHWAGQYSGTSQVNRVVSNQVDPLSGQPAFKSSKVNVVRHPIAQYGLYVGDRWQPDRECYASFQQQEYGVWRIGVETPLHKFNWSTGNEKLLTLDMPNGWLAVQCAHDAKANSMPIIEGIMVCSSNPIALDYERLTAQVKQPLSLAALIDIVTSEGGAKLICSCFKVTDKQIMEALNDGRCRSLNDLQAELKCGTNCGSCIPEIKQCLEKIPTVSTI